MNRGRAYLNGEWVDGNALSLPIDDVGFVQGATIVERLRTFAGRPFRVEEHLARLSRSLEIVGWDAASVAEVRQAIAGFCDRNAGIIPLEDDWSIVAFITPGASAAAGRTVCVHGLPLPFHVWAHKFTAGEQVCITDVRQVPSNCWPAELKCRSRMHYYLADREADRRCPGARAMLLDQRGFVGEASTANVVAYFKDLGLVTPRREGVLPGISQQVLFELADKMGLDSGEDDILPDDLAAADEVFVTSTSVSILPVVAQNGKPIGAGKPGPMYRRLLAAWSELVGVDIQAQAERFANRG